MVLICYFTKILELADLLVGKSFLYIVVTKTVAVKGPAFHETHVYVPRF